MHTNPLFFPCQFFYFPPFQISFTNVQRIVNGVLSLAGSGRFARAARIAPAGAPFPREDEGSDGGARINAGRTLGEKA